MNKNNFSIIMNKIEFYCIMYVQSSNYVNAFFYRNKIHSLLFDRLCRVIDIYHINRAYIVI